MSPTTWYIVETPQGPWFYSSRLYSKTYPETHRSVGIVHVVLIAEIGAKQLILVVGEKKCSECLGAAHSP